MRALLVYVVLICTAVYGADLPREYPYPSQGADYSVYDGDTITVTIVLWDTTTKRIKLRIRDIDTPEMHTNQRAAAEKAKAYAVYWLSSRKKPIRVVITKWRGKYGRPIGDFITDDDSLSAYLLRSKVSVVYGQKKKYENQAFLDAMAQLPDPKGL